MIRLVCLLFVAASPTLPARAEILHVVRFGAAPIVMVWPEAAPSPAGAAVFAVASNSGFVIEAVRPGGAPLTPDDLEAAGFVFRRTGAGPNAAIVGEVTARAVETGVAIYVAALQTAQQPGPPRSQALTFEARWDAARLPVLSFRVEPAGG